MKVQMVVLTSILVVKTHMIVLNCSNIHAYRDGLIMLLQDLRFGAKVFIKTDMHNFWYLFGKFKKMLAHNYEPGYLREEMYQSRLWHIWIVVLLHLFFVNNNFAKRYMMTISTHEYCLRITSNTTWIVVCSCIKLLVDFTKCSSLTNLYLQILKCIVSTTFNT